MIYNLKTPVPRLFPWRAKTRIYWRNIVLCCIVKMQTGAQGSHVPLIKCHSARHTRIPKNNNNNTNWRS